MVFGYNTSQFPDHITWFWCVVRVLVAELVFGNHTNQFQDHTSWFWSVVRVLVAELMFGNHTNQFQDHISWFWCVVRVLVTELVFGKNSKQFPPHGLWFWCVMRTLVTLITELVFGNHTKHSQSENSYFDVWWGYLWSSVGTRVLLQILLRNRDVWFTPFKMSQVVAVWIVFYIPEDQNVRVGNLPEEETDACTFKNSSNILKLSLPLFILFWSFLYEFSFHSAEVEWPEGLLKLGR